MNKKDPYIGHEIAARTPFVLQFSSYSLLTPNNPPPPFVKRGINPAGFDGQSTGKSTSLLHGDSFLSPIFQIQFAAFRTMLRRGLGCALQRLGVRRRAYQATLYSVSSYAVELGAKTSTAQLGALYGSQSGTLRFGALRCRAYLATPYGVARRPLRISSKSPTTQVGNPYAAARIALRCTAPPLKQITSLTI